MKTNQGHERRPLCPKQGQHLKASGAHPTQTFLKCPHPPAPVSNAICSFAGRVLRTCERPLQPVGKSTAECNDG